MKQKRGGHGPEVYRNLGLTNAVIVHLSKSIHFRLKDLAKRKGEPLQSVLRRLIETGLARAARNF